MDPVTLGVISVCTLILVTVIVSLIFGSKEDYESAIRRQRQEQDAFITSLTTTTKSTKTRKKWNKLKEKRKQAKGSRNFDNEDLGDNEEGDSEPSTPVDKVNGEGFVATPEDENSSENAVKSILKESGNKTSNKKQSGKGKKTRHLSFSDEQENVSPATDVVVEAVQVQEIQSLSSEVPSSMENVQTDKKEMQLVEETVVQKTEVVAPEAQRSFSPEIKKKKTKGKTGIEGKSVYSVKEVVKFINGANLSSAETQEVVDSLLNRNEEKWEKPGKGDSLEVLKKHLQEKDQVVEEERNKAESANAKMKEMSMEIQKERGKFKTYQQSANNKIAAQGQELQAMQRRMQAAHEANANEARRLQATIQQETNERKNDTMRINQLKADNDSLQRELSEMQKIQKQVKTELVAAKERTTQLEAQSKVWKDKYAEYEAEISRLSTTAQTASVNSVENDNAEELERQLAEKEAELNVMRNSLQEANNNVDNLQQQNDELDKNICLLENELEETKDKVKKDQKVIEELANKLDDQMASQIDGGSELADKVLELEDKLKASEDELAKVQKIVNENDKEKEKIEEILDKQKTKNNELREKNWKAMDTLAMTEKKFEDIKKKLTAVEKQRDSAVEKCDNYKKVLEDTESMLTRLQNSVEGELADYQQKVTVLTQDRDDARSRLEQLETQIAEVKAKEASHVEKISILQKSLKSSEDSHSLAQKRIESLEVEIKTAKETSASIENKSKEEETKVLQSKLDDVNSKLLEVTKVEKELRNELVKTEQLFNSKLHETNKKLEESSKLEDELKRLLDVEVKKNEIEKELSSKLETKEEERRKACEKENETKKKIEIIASHLKKIFPDLKDDKLSECLGEKVSGLLNKDSSNLKRIEDLEKKLEDMEKSNEEKVTALEEALSKANNTDSNKSQSDGKLKELSEKFDQEKLEWEKKIKGLEEENKNLKSNELSLKSTQEELGFCKEKIKELELASMTKSQQIEKEMSEAMEELNTKLACKEKELQEEKQNNKQLQLKLASVGSTPNGEVEGTSV